MNKFCEECGSQLDAGDKFCQNCGNRVETEITSTQYREFSMAFFRQKKESLPLPSGKWNYGIWLTNFDKINKKFGHDETARLRENMAVYADIMRDYGVYYLILDSSDNYIKNCGTKGWKQHVELLRKGIKAIKERQGAGVSFVYLFGGDEIVPMPVFPNPKPIMSDNDVDSDLPYSSLSVDDPLKDHDARIPKLACGRIPTGTDTSIDDILILLQNTVNALGNFASHNTFGLSAYAWQGASRVVNDAVCRSDLFLSPGMTIQNLPEHYTADIHIHYFNLHGGNTHPYWLGDDGRGLQNSAPIVFGPQVIAQSQHNNIIGVEACYGARFSYLGKDQSILLSAMSNQTISFAGASRIAWGPANPPINLADIVIHDYLKLLQLGKTAGEALLRGRAHVWEKNKESDPATGLVSVIEFNLFGDPAFAIPTVNQQGKSHDYTRIGAYVDGDTLSDIPGYKLEDESIATPANSGVYDAVRSAVDTVQQAIVELINRQVWEKYPEFKGVNPENASYIFDNKTYKQLQYSSQTEYISKHLLITLSGDGKIISENLSKSY